MPLISVTRLRVRSARYLPQFIWYTFRSALQVKRAPGCLGSKLLREANNTYWTCTAWEEESAMRAFMTAGVHRRAMPKLLDWCDEASVAHWDQDSAELPDWDEAHRQMIDQGRRSKVNNPSSAHLAYDIPSPRT